MTNLDGSNMNENKNPSPKVCLFLCLSTAIFISLILFWPAISNPNKTLWFSDGNIVQHRNIVNAITDIGGFGYSRGNWLGNYNTTGMQFYPNWPLIAFLPVGLGMWLNIFLHIIWATAGGWYCARQLGVSRRGAIIAGIAFGLNGHFLSLMGAGHLGKLQCIPWIPWGFGLFWQGWKSGKFRYFIGASICYAAMWQSGEPPLAYFLGMFLGCLTLVRTITGISRPKQSCPRLATWRRTAFSALFVIITIPLAWQSITKNIDFMEKFKPATHVVTHQEEKKEIVEKSSEAKASEETANYDFAVSWSFPPEESLVFLMSGRLFGVASPVYWGRTGSKTMKLKQVDDYMGVLVILLAIIALTGVRPSQPIRFMGFILCTSLLIGFGGFTPFYRLIYQLPVFSSLRVPARWIALTAFAFSMLAGLGYDRFIALSHTKRKRMTTKLPIAIASASGTLLLVAFILSTGRVAFENSLFGTSGLLASSSQPQLASIRMGHFISAFSCTGISLLLVAALFVLQKWAMKENAKLWLGRISRPTLWVCLGGLFLAGDLTINNKHYISFFNWKQFYKSDGLVDFFKRDTDEYSILTLATQRHSYLNRFASYLAPWHKLTLVEPHVVHRQNTALIPLLNALSKPVDYHINPRFYDYFGVKYVLSPMQLPTDILSKAKLKQLNRFDFPQMTPLFLYHYLGFKSAPYLVGNSIQVKSDQDAIGQIKNPAFNIQKTAAIENAKNNLKNNPISGTIKTSQKTKHHIRIETNTDKPAWIIQHMPYDPNWSITVNGKKQNYYKANYMQLAIPVESGISIIEMKYQTTKIALTIVIISWIIGLLIVTAMAFIRHGKQKVVNDIQPA